MTRRNEGELFCCFGRRCLFDVRVEASWFAPTQERYEPRTGRAPAVFFCDPPPRCLAVRLSDRALFSLGVIFFVLSHRAPLARRSRLVALLAACPTRSARYSLRKRPSENSEQFKVCFFRFLRFLLRDLVKRRHRTIVKERQAAEQSSKLSSTGGAPSAARSRGAGAGNYDADDRLRRQLPPPPPPARGGDTRGPRAGMPAAVRG